MSDHLGDLIELHALGALDDAERATVDAHVAGCAACATALGHAEAAIFALDAAYVEPVEPPASPFASATTVTTPHAGVASRVTPLRRRQRSALFAARALAAAALFGLGFGTDALLGTRSAPSEDGALATIAGSHFSHVSLASASTDAPHVKVLYARDGSWLYAIVDGPAATYRLRVRDAVRGLSERTFVQNGSVGTSFQSHLPSPPIAVDLVRASDGSVVESATCVYSAKP